MIKRAALGASVAVLIAGEASAQSRTAKATVIKAGKQAWRYKFVPANQDAVDLQVITGHLAWAG